MTLRQRGLVALAGIVACSVGVAVTGLPLVASFLATSVIAAWLLAGRFGAVMATSLAFIVQATIVTLTGIASWTLGAPYAASTLIGLALFPAAVGVAAATPRGGRAHGVDQRPLTAEAVRNRAWFWPHLGAFAGALYVTGVLALSKLLPEANRYVWAMHNDAANNLLMVRDLVNEHGISLGKGANPVPFTTSLLSLFQVGTRTSYLAHGNLLGDIVGVQGFWWFVISALAVSVGLVALGIVRAAGSSPRLGAVVAAAASLICNLWFVVGYPLDYGFLNASLGLVLLFIGLLVYLHRDRAPYTTLGLLILVCTLSALTWTPTVVFPGIMAIATVLEKWRKLGRPHGPGTSFVVASALFAIAMLALITIPSFLSNSDVASAPGGAARFSTWLWWVTPILLTVVSLGAFGLRSALGRTLIALSVGHFLVVGALLVMNRAAADPWSYYQKKMLWFGSVYLLLLTMVVAIAWVITQRLPGRVRTLAIATIIGVFFLSFNWSAPNPRTFRLKDTFAQIVTAQMPGYSDTIAQQIIHDDLIGLRVYWKSQNVEFDLWRNFWNISNWANSLKPRVFNLRLLAYDLPPTDSSQLCSLARLAASEPTVVTTDTGLPEQLAKRCPEQSFRFSRD